MDLGDQRRFGASSETAIEGVGVILTLSEPHTFYLAK